MQVLRNTILGSLFRRFSLVLNNEGLYRLISIRGTSDNRIFLTDDPVKICEILGLDYEKFKEADKEEAFEMIKNCKCFPQHVFIGREPSGSPLLDEFREYVENNPNKVSDYQPINKEYLIECLDLPTLKTVIDEGHTAISEFPKVYKHKFEEMKRKLIEEEGYDPRNFSVDLPKFMGSFGGGTSLHYKWLFVKNNIDDIVDKYLEVTGRKEREENVAR